MFTSIYKTKLTFSVFAIILANGLFSSCSDDDKGPANIMDENRIVFEEQNIPLVQGILDEFQNEYQINLSSFDFENQKDEDSVESLIIIYITKEGNSNLEGTYAFKPYNDADFNPSIHFPFALSAIEVPFSNGSFDESDSNFFDGSNLAEGTVVIEKYGDDHSLEIELMYGNERVQAFFDGPLISRDNL